MSIQILSVRPELVEGPQGFDKLSPNGVMGFLQHRSGQLAPLRATHARRGSP